MLMRKQATIKFDDIDTMCETISEELQEQFKEQAQQIMEGYADYLKHPECEYEYFKYPGKIIDDIETVNTNMTQLIMQQYRDRLETNRVKFSDLEWPGIEANYAEHKADHGLIENKGLSGHMKQHAKVCEEPGS